MPTLSEAITAIRAGRINEARFMLTRILATDGNNITALLWMTEVAQTPEELRTYLERVLAIDPTNAPARRGLELLDKANEQPPLVATDQLAPNQPASTNTASDQQRMSPAESKPQRSTKVCPFCWKTISADSSTCRFCGHELTVTTNPALVKVSTPKAKWTTPQFIFLAAILVLVASMVVAVVLSAVSRSSQERSAISAPVVTPRPFPSELQTPPPKPNPYPVLEDLQEYPRVSELDLVKRPDYYKNKPVCLDEVMVFGVREDRGVTTFGIQSSSGNSTMSETVVYAGTIPELVDSVSIILGGYVVGTEADLNISSSSRPVILMQRFHAYGPNGMFNNYTVGDESAKKCKPSEG